MGASRFLGSNMVDEGSRDAQTTLRLGSATRAAAALCNRREIVRISSMPKVDDAPRGDGVTKALELVSIHHDKTKVKCTAVLVGQTQSNMSAPNATDTTMSSGYPTPITYRGLLSGRNPVHVSTLPRSQ